ncbi:Os06g0669200 [Oryza sativa Japonica Group]|uniref:Os06g0669200 protein n=1 Tax=Oryza sativa subsp. japonica TaxID=39947 RepID=A0A0P0WZY2_ORYSJ|nr:hypothetical protein EE612_035931 [Oryza sativa]BAS99059.1 Os06g0669200 [Oryza sativa Japonica Group]
MRRRASPHSPSLPGGCWCCWRGMWPPWNGRLPTAAAAGSRRSAALLLCRVAPAASSPAAEQFAQRRGERRREEREYEEEGKEMAWHPDMWGPHGSYVDSAAT